MKQRILVIFKVLIIFFIIIPFLKLSFAQKDLIYFSFEKQGDKYFIGIEGEFLNFYKNENLNYEWILFLENGQLTFETYRPFLYFESNDIVRSGKVRIYSNNLNFDKEYSFTFNQRNRPVVSIVRYKEEFNLILPINKLEKGDKLFPLVSNFSSDNLSIAWNVSGKFYYSLLFDPEGVPNDTEIKLIVTNINNPAEFSSDIVKIQK